MSDQDDVQQNRVNERVEYMCMGLVISKDRADDLLCEGWIMVDITNADSVCREVMLKMADSEVVYE